MAGEREDRRSGPPTDTAEVVVATLPVQPPRLEELRLPKTLVAVLVIAAMFGASATVASIIAARTAAESGVAQQEDVIRNREILNSVCENARALTLAHTTASPEPCPTGDAR